MAERWVVGWVVWMVDLKVAKRAESKAVSMVVATADRMVASASRWAGEMVAWRVVARAGPTAVSDWYWAAP